MLFLILPIFENALIIKLCGDKLVFLSFCQIVFIDKESFPTGIVIFQGLHNDWVNSLTVKNKSVFLSLLSGEAIQFADIFISDSFLTPDERRFKVASARANFPAATGLLIAIGDFSPIAIASPESESKFDKVIALSETGI